MKRPAGKSARITAAARGIEKAFAQASVEENATVAIAAIHVAAAVQTAAAHGQRTWPVQLDIKNWLKLSEAVWRTLVSLAERGYHYFFLAFFSKSPARPPTGLAALWGAFSGGALWDGG